MIIAKSPSSIGESGMSHDSSKCIQCARVLAHAGMLAHLLFLRFADSPLIGVCWGQDRGVHRGQPVLVGALRPRATLHRSLLHHQLLAPRTPITATMWSITSTPTRCTVQRRGSSSSSSRSSYHPVRRPAQTPMRQGILLWLIGIPIPIIILIALFTH